MESSGAPAREDEPEIARPESGDNGLVDVVRIIARLNVGGPAIHVRNLSVGLNGRYRTLLVAGEVDSGEVELPGVGEAELELMRLPQLGRRINAWQDLVAFLALLRLLLRVRPRIVHTHTAKAGTLGRLAALLAGVPIRVHTFHGHVMRGYFSPLKTRLVIFAERLLARTSTRIIAISEAQAHDLTHTLGVCRPERVQVVPLGFDLARFDGERLDSLRGEFRRELASGELPVLTVVGRLVPIKNHALLLDSLAILRGRGVEFVLGVVGGGPLEQRLREQAKSLGLTGSIRFLGWREDLERIYADSDVVVLTSINEGTPVCLIEALAAGCAVVATDVGGVRDVLEEGELGRIVPSQDADALAHAIAELIARPEAKASLARSGPASVRRRYGLQRLLDDVAGMYDELLETEGHPRGSRLGTH